MRITNGYSPRTIITIFTNPHAQSARIFSIMARFNLTHPQTTKIVTVDDVTVAFTQASLDGNREPLAILKRMTAELHLSWPENAKERAFITGLNDDDRETYVKAWSDYIVTGVDAICAILEYNEPRKMTEKIADRLKKAGLSPIDMKFEVVEQFVVTNERCFKPETGRLEDLPDFKDFGVDSLETYKIFDEPLISHQQAKRLYCPHVSHVKDKENSFINECEGFKSGNLSGVLNALKDRRTYRESDDKKMFRSLLTAKESPTDVLESIADLIKATVKNDTLRKMELDELANAGPFDRYPVEYWFQKLFSSYEPKNTSFDFDVYRNAWKIVARMIKTSITEHDTDVKEKFKSPHQVRAKLFQPDGSITARERKRENSNAGFPTFKKYLSEDWDAFIDEADAIAANPSQYNPLHYPMIVGNRIVGKNLQIPEDATSDEADDIIRKKNKQRVIQMGSSVEFIVGSRFCHPLLRLLSTKCEAFKGLKSWNGVRGDIATRMMRHKTGRTPIAKAFGADASNFDASVTIFDWVMSKRLFQMIFPGNNELLEWYFTLCAFAPTITLDGQRRPVVVRGCSGMASGIAATAIVDSIVELVRAVAVLIETGIITNDPMTTLPKDLGVYVCGDDMGYLLPTTVDSNVLTAERFSVEYAKYGGTAHADKQLVTTPDSDLGITLLFLKRLFSEKTSEVGFGTRLIAHTATGLVYTNPADFTSANRILDGFMAKLKSENDLEAKVYGELAESEHIAQLKDGDLTAGSKDVLRQMKKCGEANKRVKAMLEEVHDGGYSALLDAFADENVLWTDRVTSLDALESLVNMGIISEDEAEDRLAMRAALVPFDTGRMHLIKVVQQIEENHPHPNFKEFVEWAYSVNPSFFNIALLEGDEANHMANHIRATKGSGIETWKIMPLLKELTNSNDTLYGGYPTRAVLLENLVREGRTVTYMSTILNGHDLPFDTIFETIRLVIKELIDQPKVYLAAGCGNETARFEYIKNQVLGFKRTVREAQHTANRDLITQSLDGMIGFDDDLRDIYVSVKRDAITKEAATRALVINQDDVK